MSIEDKLRDVAGEQRLKDIMRNVKEAKLAKWFQV